MIGEKIDRLFLEKDCPYCGVIRATLNIKAATQDDFRGTEGQKLLVFSTLSNEASVEMLERFGFTGKFIPLLQTSDGDVLEDSEDIIRYLRDNGMASPKS